MNNIRARVDSQLHAHDIKVSNARHFQRYLFHVQSGAVLLIVTGHFTVEQKSSPFLNDKAISIYRCNANNVNLDTLEHQVANSVHIDTRTMPNGKQVSVIYHKTVFPQGVYLVTKQSSDRIIYVQAMYKFNIGTHTQYLTLSSINLEFDRSLSIFFNVHRSKNSQATKTQMNIPPHIQALYTISGNKLRTLFT